MKYGLHARLKILIFALICGTSAYSGTSTGNLAVTASVVGSCALTATSPVAFGTIDGTFTSLTQATGSVTVLCTAAETYSIALGPGNNPTPGFTFRRMTNGSSDFIDYVLYSNGGFSTPWGDGTNFGGALTSLSGTGTLQVYTVYGQIPTGQTPVPAGAYSDTILVTVTYN